MMRRSPPARPPVYSAALRHARRLLCARVAGAAQAPDPIFRRSYAVVAAEVEAHLRQEEIVLGACRVQRLQDRLHERRRENAAILSALHHTLSAVEDGDFHAARRLLAALVDILSLHRISADLALPRSAAQMATPPRMRGRAARPPTLHAPASLRPGRAAGTRRPAGTRADFQ